MRAKPRISKGSDGSVLSATTLISVDCAIWRGNMISHTRSKDLIQLLQKGYCEEKIRCVFAVIKI